MSNNTVTPQNSPNTLIITDKDQNQVIVTQPVTSIIEITAPGTQGPNISPETSILIISESNPSTSTVIQPDVKTITISATGVQGPAGPAPDTSSLVSITTFNAFTSSYTTGSFTGSFIGDGSQLTGIVSSKWTGSNPISRESDVEVTGSFSVTGDITIGGGGFFDPIGAQQVVLKRYGDNINANEFVTTKARGTKETPTPVQHGDYLGGVEFQGYDGTGYVRSSFILPIVTGSIATGDVRSDLRFSTRQGGGNNFNYPLVITSDRKVGINNVSPTYTLDVNGSGRFIDGLTVTGSGIFTDIYSPILNSEGDLRRIINPQGAQLSNNTATSTGVIKFKIPSVVGNNYSNYGFVVQIGSQGGLLSETFIQARWMVSGFDQLEAYTLGRNFKVRVGTDGTDQYLLIGETDSAWYRTNITLREFYVDYIYKDIDTFKEGWEVSFDTDISDISINKTVTNSDYAQQFFGYLQLTNQTFATGSWNTIATLDTLSGTGTFLLKRINQGLLNFTVADSYGRRILKLNYLTQYSPNLYQGIRITTDNKVQVLIGTSYNSVNDIYVFNSKGVTLTNATASGAETVDKVITFNSTEEGEITTDPLTVRNNFTVTGSTVLKGSGTTSSTTSLLVENANASASLSVNDAGNVGIGKIPNYPLDISITNGGNPNSGMYVSGIHPDGRAILYGKANNNVEQMLYWWHNGGIGVGIGSSARGGAVSYKDDRSYYGPSHGMYFMETGTIFGPLNVKYRLGVTTSTTNTSFATGVANNLTNIESNTFTFTAKSHTFYTGTTTGNQALPNQFVPLHLSSSGSVGIGTTTPSYTLDVSGSGRFTDGLTVTGSLVTQGQTIDPALIWFMS